MTMTDVLEHQKKHGFVKEVEAVLGKPLQPYQKAMLGLSPKPRQNKTELAFGLILEAQKQRREIIEYKPFGIRLEWGAHPETGKPQVYSPDFTVWETGAAFLRLIEVKGPHIWQKDRIRFRGCRAEWGMWFQFEMWQKKAGQWKRLE